MRIFITGGFGFVGGRLALYLTERGHEVIIGSRGQNIPANWPMEPKVKKIEWYDDKILENLCKGIDVVVHAAGMNAQDCATDPIAALTFNGLATARLVEAANRAGVSRFVYLSTAHVYRSPLIGAITEETCPRNLHPYATSHLAGENAVLGADRHGKIECIVLRLSNVFGVPAHEDANCWTLLVNDLCKQAVQTRKIVLKTSGLQMRDFIAASDVCHVVEKLLPGESNINRSGIYNVGAGVSLTVLEMAKLIQQRCSSVLKIFPELERVVSPIGERHFPLFYEVKKLNALGIDSNLHGSTLEIDRLIRFCKLTFT